MESFVFGVGSHFNDLSLERKENEWMSVYAFILQTLSH